jgi:hypothetical protein
MRKYETALIQRQVHALGDKKQKFGDISCAKDASRLDAYYQSKFVSQTVMQTLVDNLDLSRWAIRGRESNGSIELQV